MLSGFAALPGLINCELHVKRHDLTRVHRSSEFGHKGSGNYWPKAPEGACLTRYLKYADFNFGASGSDYGLMLLIISTFFPVFFDHYYLTLSVSLPIFHSGISRSNFFCPCPLESILRPRLIEGRWQTRSDSAQLLIT